MRMSCALAVLAVAATLVVAHAGAPTVARAQPPGAHDAYLDDGARELVRQARARRMLLDRRITEYETIVRERLSAGMRAVARERLLFRRETVSRVHWMRDDTIRIEVLGAREVVPPATPREQVPGDLHGYLPQLAFDPADAELLLRTDNRAIRHPLAAGAEEFYRYASGDTTVIRLPDGRSVRLRELRVTARQRDPQLMNASFWLDTETHAIVRAYFNLARAYDLGRDTRRGRPPRLLPTVEAELGFVAIEYGLWDLQWWLPRVVAAEGVVRAGPIHVPLRFERTYDDYRVVADDAPLVAIDTAGPPAQRCRPRGQLSVQVNVGGTTPRDTAAPAAAAAPDTVAADTARARRRLPTDTVVVAATEPGCERYWVIAPAAGIDLVNSPYLPPAGIYDEGDLLDAPELRAIRRRVAALPRAPWRLEAPRFDYGLLAPGLVRYNRVEGVSVGVRTRLDLPRSELTAEARAAVPSGEFGGELGVRRDVLGWSVRPAAYRRVQTMDEWVPAFGLRASLSALLLGRDEHDYYRTSGLELAGAPAGHGDWLDWRIYAERQQPLDKATDFSVRRLFDDVHRFRPNPPADEADQLGAALRLRWRRGLDPAGVRGGLELAVDGETGTHQLGRVALTATLGTPLPGRFVAGLEAAAGTSAGAVTLQRAWRLGGAPTLRGYAPGSALGAAFWRARAEVATALPLARLALFSDIGWAGQRDQLFTRPTLGTRATLWSAGVGLSALDGLLRLDLARPVRGRAAWRLHMYVDGVL